MIASRSVSLCITLLRRTVVLAAAAACMTASSACTSSHSAGSDHGDHAADSAVAAAFDQQFIDMMVPHHEGAVMMAMTARTRSEHAELKALAGQIIESQDAEIAQMKAWRKQWYGSDATPAVAHMPMMNGVDHGAMGDMVQTNELLTTASPFDREFIAAMIPHHEMAVQAAKLAQQKGEHAELMALAGQIIAAQETEIADMRRWRSSWYGE